MNDLLIQHSYPCPYCGEQIDTYIDVSQGNQQTIEDCSVCCRPIELLIDIDGATQKITLTARSDSE